MHIRRIATFAAGATAMWFLDPAQGHRRRAVARDKVRSRAKRIERAAERADRYEAGVVAGEEARARGKGRYREHGFVDLREHLRGEIHRQGVVDVNVDVDAEGRVTLRGEVDRRHHDDVVRTVTTTDGVSELIDLTHGPGEPAPNKAPAIAASTIAARRV